MIAVTLSHDAMKNYIRAKEQKQNKQTNKQTNGAPLPPMHEREHFVLSS